MTDTDTTFNGILASTSTASFRIGSRGQAANEYFNGTIDEVRVYSQALTAMDIQKQYAAGLPRHQLAEK